MPLHQQTEGLGVFGGEYGEGHIRTVQDGPGRPPPPAKVGTCIYKAFTMMIAGLLYSMGQAGSLTASDGM